VWVIVEAPNRTMETIERLGTLTVEQLRTIRATDYIRLVCLLHKHQGHDHQALEEFRAAWPGSPLLSQLDREWRTKAAVLPAVTTGATWGAPLSLASPASADFGAMVRAATILGKLPTKQVPLNSLLPIMTTGATASWVGQGLQKPASAGTLALVTVAFFKVVAFFVLSAELVRLSVPGADVLVRDELRRKIVEFLDQQAFDPTVTEVADVTPGSLTNGAPSSAASGTTAAAALTDVKKLITDFTAQNPDAESLWLLMTPSVAVALAVATNSQTLTAQGGTLFGCNVLTSTTIGAQIVALDPSQILFAAEPGIRMDLSEQATLELDSAPANPSTAASIYQPLWARNLVAVRAERTVGWKRARANCVRTISTVAYV
jgi:hypothetical protein